MAANELALNQNSTVDQRWSSLRPRREISPGAGHVFGADLQHSLPLLLFSRRINSTDHPETSVHELGKGQTDLFDSGRSLRQ